MSAKEREVKVNREIRELHKRSGLKVYVVATGGGSNIQHLLALEPDASNTILECIFPYGREALNKFLGEVIDKSGSEDTAIKMANCAYERGVELVTKSGGDTSKVVGLALTAVIATSRKLKGEHRACVALRARDEIRQLSVKFRKNAEGWSASSRVTENIESGRLAINLLLGYAGLDQGTVYAGTMVSDDLVKRSLRGDEVIIRPRITKLDTKPNFPRMIEIDGRVSAGEGLKSDKHLLFPGCFNPLHEGHQLIASTAEKLTGRQVVYAINVDHPDKGLLDEAELSKRREQFNWKASLLLTSGQRLFVEKAKAYPGFGFVIGVDALLRMLDARYYLNDDLAKMMDTFVSLGTKFYVSARESDGVVTTLETALASIPEHYHSLFVDLGVSSPASSTSIRKSCARV